MSGAMSLTGTYDVPDLPEVLALLTRRGCTGRLQLRAGSRHAVIRLFDGNAVAIEGVASSWSEGTTDVRSLLEEVFFEALRTGRGSFEFQPEQGARPEETGRAVRLATAVAAAQQRLEEWREVEAVIPSLDAVPKLGEEIEGKEIRLTQEQWRILVSIDGRRTVGGIARRLGGKPVAICRVLRPLVESGAVAFDRSEPLALRDLPVVGPHPSDQGSESAEGQDPAEGGADAAAPKRPRRGAGFRVLAR